MRNLIYGTIALTFMFLISWFLKYVVLKVAPLISVSPENVGVGVVFLIVAYGVGIVVTDFIDG